MHQSTYPAEFVALKLLGLTATESTLINQIWQFLVHQILDLLHGRFEAFFRRAGDAQI